MLVTGQRRESFGAPSAAVGQALTELARVRPNVDIVRHLHPNPHAIPTPPTVAGPVRIAVRYGGQPGPALPVRAASPRPAVEPCASAEAAVSR